MGIHRVALLQCARLHSCSADSFSAASFRVPWILCASRGKRTAERLHS